MKRAVICATAVLLLVFLLGACSAGAEPEAMAREFLQEFYTFSDPQEALSHLAQIDERGAEASVELKKSRFGSYFTEDEFLVFLVSPKWMDLCSRSALDALTFEPSEITLNGSDGSYDFSLTVTVTDTKNGTAEEVEQSGHLTFDEYGKISDHYFDNLNAL